MSELVSMEDPSSLASSATADDDQPRKYLRRNHVRTLILFSRPTDWSKHFLIRLLLFQDVSIGVVSSRRTMVAFSFVNRLPLDR